MDYKKEHQKKIDIIQEVMAGYAEDLGVPHDEQSAFGLLGYLMVKPIPTSTTPEDKEGKNENDVWEI